MGNQRQQLREKDRPALVLTVGSMVIRPNQARGATRYAVVQLEGQRESLDADRVRFPEEASAAIGA
jgi:hypothetical protein